MSTDENRIDGPPSPQDYPPELQNALRRMSLRGLGPVVDMETGERVAVDGELVDEDDLNSALRNTADGDWGREAALDLITLHGRWLTTLEEHGYIEYDETEYAKYAAIDWEHVTENLDATGFDSAERTTFLVGSPSEVNILRIACSLASSSPVNLRTALTSFDERNQRLVLRAVAHSMGGYATSGMFITHLTTGVQQ